LGQLAKELTLVGQRRNPDATNPGPEAELFPTGPNVAMVESQSGCIIRPFHESPNFGFLDLDANIRLAIPPKELVSASPPDEPSKELLEWADKEGIDLIGMKIQPAGSDKVFYGTKLLGTRAWRIDEASLSTLAADLQAGKPLNLAQPVD